VPQIKKEDVEKILDWEKMNTEGVDIPFKPGRVILQVRVTLNRDVFA